MTISVAVTLLCDGRRQSGCHWSFDLGSDPDPKAVTARWRHAAELGWTKEGGPDGKALHLCPACNAALIAGHDVRLAPAEEPPSRNIGEAAQLARRRAAAAAPGAPRW